MLAYGSHTDFAYGLEYHDLEEIVEEVEPSHPEFEKKRAKLISSTDVIRYKYTPQRLIAYIYRCKNYSFNDSTDALTF